MRLDGRSRGVSGKVFFSLRRKGRGWRGGGGGGGGRREEKEGSKEEERKERPVFCWTLIFECGTQITLLPREKKTER